MNIEALNVPGILLIRPRVFKDTRGQFLETWRASTYDGIGIGPFVQDNVSVSRRGVVRGLHLQHPNAQGKLVSALHGRVFDVAVDVRVRSPTFGAWAGAELSAENGAQLWIPQGFAHGFMALDDNVVFCYKCTDFYSPEAELTVLWNDPGLDIAWPIVDEPIVAMKDAAAPRLKNIPEDKLPPFQR